MSTPLMKLILNCRKDSDTVVVQTRGHTFEESGHVFERRRQLDSPFRPKLGPLSQNAPLERFYSELQSTNYGLKVKSDSVP